MTSLNISLPEVLKTYVEGQVASGDWGTPSEYIRELIRQDKERRMANLEQELLAAAKGPKIEVSISEIRKKGLITALRERARRAWKSLDLLSATQRLWILWNNLTGTKLKQSGVWRNVGKRLW
jgi:antitoxin ParD1/3/4